MNSIPELDATYQFIFDINSEIGSRSRERAIAAYQWVLATFEPLRLKELAILVSADDGGRLDLEFTAEDLEQRCSNFLVVNSRGFVEFTHASARDFIINYQDGKVFSPTADNCKLAKTCMSLLLCDETMAKLHEKTMSNCDIAREEPRQISSESKVTSYICYHWPYHCKLIDSQLRSQFQLSNTIEALLTRDSTAWEQFWLSNESTRWWPTRQIRQSMEILKAGELEAIYLECYDNSLRDNPSGKPNPILAICTFNFVELFDSRTMANRIDFMARTCFDNTALIMACKFGGLEVVQRLLQSSAVQSSINATGDRRTLNTALHAAAARGNSTVVDFLLTKGANIFAKNAANHTPYFAAVDMGHDEILRSLMQHERFLRNQKHSPRIPGQFPDDFDQYLSHEPPAMSTVTHGSKYGGPELFQYAIVYERIACVRLLLEQEDSDLTDGSRQKLLEVAASTGSVQILKLLVGYDASTPSRLRELTGDLASRESTEERRLRRQRSMYAEGTHIHDSRIDIRGDYPTPLLRISDIYVPKTFIWLMKMSLEPWLPPGPDFLKLLYPELGSAPRHMLDLRKPTLRVLKQTMEVAEEGTLKFVSASDDNGNTLLHYLCRIRKQDFFTTGFLVELLVDNRSPLFQQNRSGRTAFQCLVERLQEELEFLSNLLHAPGRKTFAPLWNLMALNMIEATLARRHECQSDLQAERFEWLNSWREELREAIHKPTWPPTVAHSAEWLNYQLQSRTCHEGTI
jgi:ankyrin repeat protein